MFYKILRPFMWFIYKITHKVVVFNRKNVINDGKSIVICNHISKMDVCVVSEVHKDKVCYLAKKEWFNNKLFAWVLKRFGVIAIDRDNPSLTSIRDGLKVLKDGKTLGIFPEGTRNKQNTEIQPFKTGVAMFAIKGQAKIVPIVIHQKIKMFKTNYAMVGEPFELSEYYGKKFNEDVANEATNVIYNKMVELQKELNEKVLSIKN
ncbi:MAG: 1-acyl-sn-glycerol-3-phosphate acyltransferase [Clostridia bacterium]|nr:1-acyl-sn-glycerol-3-phosphate acyltransferase [Clostridia bacterium]